MEILQPNELFLQKTHFYTKFVLYSFISTSIFKVLKSEEKCEHYNHFSTYAINLVFFI